MNAERLLAHFDTISEAPDAVARLRRFILDLAVRGKLVEQDPEDEPAEELLRCISKHTKTSPVTANGDSPFPFDLPIGWAHTTLRALVWSSNSGWSPKTLDAPRVGDEWGILKVSAVSWDQFRPEANKQVLPGTQPKPQAVIRKGDFLISRANTAELVARAVIVESEPVKLMMSDKIVRLELVELCEPKYVLINNNHSSFSRGYYAERATGVSPSMKNVTRDVILDLPIPLSPLAEQHRIVVKVDELMALCDQLEAARQEREQTRERLVAASLPRLNEPAEDPASFRQHATFALQTLPFLTTNPAQIKQLRQTILNLAVRGRLVEQDPEDQDKTARERLVEFAESCSLIPGSWLYVPLACLLAEDTRNGYSRKPDDAKDGFPVLRISAGTARPGGLVDEGEFKLISGIDEVLASQYAVQRGDLLACRFNGNKAYVGRLSLFMGYSGKQFIYPDKLIRVRLAEWLAEPAFFRCISNSDLVREEVEEKCATTVGNWGISAGKLKTCMFPIPPLAEQHRIVAKVDELMALCDQLEQQLSQAGQQRRRLLEAVLAEALDGRLDRQEESHADVA